MKAKNYLLSIFYFCIVSTPLIFSKGGYFGYVVPRTLFFEIAVITLSLLLLFWASKNIKDINLTIIDAAWLLLLVIYTLSSLNTNNKITAVFSNYERMEGVWLQIHLFMFYIINRIYKVSLLRSTSFSLIIALFVCLYSVREEHQYRNISTIGNANSLAVYILLHLFILAIWMNEALTYWQKHTIVIIAFSCLTYILLTWSLTYSGSRSALIGLVLGLVSFFALNFRRVSIRAKRTELFIVPIIIISGFILRNNILLNAADTFTTRKILWQIAWEGGLYKWFIGWGQDGFSDIFVKFYHAFLYKSSIWYDRPHNIFLDWFCLGGILGLLAFIAFLSAIIYTIWHQKTSLTYIQRTLFTSLLVAYVGFGFFNFEVLVSWIPLIVIIAYIANQHPKSFLLVVLPKKLLLYTATCSCFVLVFINYHIVRDYNKFNTYLNNDNLDTLLGNAMTIHESNTFHSHDVAERFANLAYEVEKSPLEQQQKQAFFTMALQMIQREGDRHTLSLRDKYLKAVLEKQMGDFNASIKSTQEILGVSNLFLTALKLQAEDYEQKGDIHHALLSYQKAYLSDKNNPVFLLEKMRLLNIIHDEQTTHEAISSMDDMAFIAYINTLPDWQASPLFRKNLLKRFSAVNQQNQYKYSTHYFYIWIMMAFEERDPLLIRTAFKMYDGIFIPNDFKAFYALRDAALNGIRPDGIINFMQEYPGQ